MGGVAVIGWAAGGAALGALGRHALGLALPLGATLAVNLLGAALMGWLATRALGPRQRAFAMTGVCGGFTTFSAFGHEVAMLLPARPDAAAAYVAVSAALWVAGAWVGHMLGQGRAGPRHP